jgi:hypothetical protein
MTVNLILHKSFDQTIRQYIRRKGDTVCLISQGKQEQRARQNFKVKQLIKYIE